MAEAELRNMIMNFRVSDLQLLLSFAGRNKTGKKQELQGRALDLVKIKSPAVDMKVRELHNRRYHNQILGRPSSYEIPDRTANDRSMAHYEPTINNNYSTRCNSGVRPIINQGPSVSYTAGKQYMSSIAPPLSNYTSFPDVKFKELPFYDFLHVLMRPSSLVADVSERFQETTYPFTLTPKQAHEISVSRDASGNYECQILLRFCSLDTTCEQEDNFPPSVGVKVNGKPVTLPSPIPTNRPGLEPKRPSKPVNITPQSKLSPTVSNMVNVSWASSYGRSFAVGLYIARQLSSQTLLKRLKANGVRNPDYTTQMIKEKLQQGQDSEIATTSLRGSLLCPLGKIKMELPCRALTCNHLQCFDASLYIQMNEKKPKWICPVCDKQALFKTLTLDGLFMDIGAKVPAECTEVQFHEDGSWTPILPVKEPKDAKKTVIEQGPKKKSKKPVEVVDLSSDSDSEDMWTYNALPETTVKMNTDSSPPPVMYLPPDADTITNTILSVPATTTVTPLSPETLCAPPVIPNEPVEPLCILPDINPIHPDNSMPSTSSSSPGLGSTYTPMPPQYIPSDISSYCPTVSSAFEEPLNLLSVSQNIPSCNGFDFFSLLQVPPVEAQKLREYEQQETNGSPDVISLD